MRALRGHAIRLSFWGAILIAGCSPQALYFILPESKEPAELKRLASEDKKEVKVVLWTYMSLDPREEFIQADRHLATMLAEEIRKLSEENKDKVTVIKPNLVEQYKNHHDNWKFMDLEQIGRDFQADYVLNLEINSMSLYEPKASNTLYRGQTEILVNLVDMKQPGERLQKVFTDRYPSEPHLDSMDVNPIAFRDQFLRHVAQRLVFYFVDHQKRTRKVMMDE
jgi:hypothetical protein